MDCSCYISSAWTVSPHTIRVSMQKQHIKGGGECMLICRPATHYSHYFRIQCCHFGSMESHASYLEVQCVK